MTMLEIATQSAAVAKVSEWNDRHYVNLVGFEPRAAGDRSTKIWIKGNVLKIEGGKGMNSPSFLASLEALKAELVAAGAVRASYADYAVEATYTMA
jgi:hypothetical protein